MKFFDFLFSWCKKYDYYTDEVIEPKIIIELRKFILIIIEKINLLINGLSNSIDNENETNSNKFISLLQSLARKIKSSWSNLHDKEHFLKVMASVFFVLFIFIFVLSFGINIYSSENKNNKFIKDAGAVCTKIMSNYGVGKTENLDIKYGENLYRLTGLAFVRQMDFNNDDSPELLLAYDDNGIYYVEVWGYERKDFVKLYSEKANFDEENITAGSSISIYHHNSRYYIGKLSKEEKGKMDLYALSRNKFKKSRSCEYDIINDIYAVKSKINSTEFETIKLSFMQPLRAEKTIETTLALLNDFGAKDIQTIESEKTEEQKKADAYYNIIGKYNNKYGKATLKTTSKKNYISGLAVADLIDFNADGNEELLLIYRYNKKVSDEDKEGNLIIKEVPTYYMEVYCWNGTAAKLCYENDGLNVYQESKKNETFYILQKDGDKTNICTNSYDYGENSNRVWKATSRISTMTNDSSFEDSFVAKVNCNYGHMTYKINNKKVYRKDFDSKGYVVPYFCNDKNNYDSSKFTVNVLETEYQNSSKLQSVISKTESTIKKINPDYKTD